MFYQYHGLICQLLVFIGICILFFKMNRGFVKYQMRRTVWSFAILIYIFMLSTVQIYNVYMGIIWVVVPLLSVRFNVFLTRQIHNYRPNR